MNIIIRGNQFMDHVVSLVFGCRGNECVLAKDYGKAVKCYTIAIGIHPYEYRYYVNRSYSYDCLNKFNEALKDAEMAISIRPDWGKCHFRKGRALKGLGKLVDAETSFQKVMDLEGKDCRDASGELLSIRKMVSQNLGCDQQTANDIANKCVDIQQTISTIQDMNHQKKVGGHSNYNNPNGNSNMSGDKRNPKAVRKYPNSGPQQSNNSQKVYSYSKPHYDNGHNNYNSNNKTGYSTGRWNKGWPKKQNNGQNSWSNQKYAPM